MPVMIDRSQDFEIAWTPESQGNDQIVLTLNANAYSCVCAAATSAGAITVGSALLSKFDASSNGFIELARYTMSTACGNNQTIVLGGVTSVQGTVTLE
jgi:hypothetical protein